MRSYLNLLVFSIYYVELKVKYLRPEGDYFTFYV